MKPAPPVTNNLTPKGCWYRVEGGSTLDGADVWCGGDRFYRATEAHVGAARRLSRVWTRVVRRSRAYIRASLGNT